MTVELPAGFSVGDWFVEPSLGRVSHGERSVKLRPREMDLLVYLASHHGSVVTVDDIITEVWSGVAVTTDSLYFSISQLRKALDDPDGDESCIETIPKRGYRLIAPVDMSERTVETGGSSLPPRRHPGKIVGVAAAAAALVAIAVAWFGVDERLPSAVAFTIPANSIAVMPFVDLTPETDYTYFSDGITEEILNQLARVPDLQVAARTSSFSFKHSDADVVEIGRSLGVSTLLEGSVRKEGDRVRIAVQLVDASTGFQIWSDTYDRELSSVFAIQNDISDRIIGALEITFAGTLADGGKKIDRTMDPLVLDEYLLGLEALRLSSFDSLARAVEHFETVLGIDPSFYKARVQLASAKLQILNTGASYDMDLVAEAEALVSDALAENPEDGSAHRVLGIVRKWQRRPDDARRQFNRALELAPSDSDAMVHLSHIVAFGGDVPRARQLLERAARIDPFASNVLHTYAFAQRQAGAIDKARDVLVRAVELHPGNPNPPWLLGRLQVNDLGEVSDGPNNFLMSARYDRADYEIAAYVAMTYLTLEMPGAAQPWIDRALRDGPGAVTSQVLESVRLVLDGRGDQAAVIAEDALREKSYRFTPHSPLTASLLTIATHELLSSGRVDDAVDLLEDTMPADKLAPAMQPGDDRLETVLAYADLPRRWLVALACAYREAGDESRAQWALDRVAGARLAAIDDFRENYRNDDYLLEAEIRALEGDTDGALAMLETAVDRHLLFAWQIQLENNFALGALRDHPRYVAVLDGVRAKIGAEQQKAVASLELLSDGVGAGERVESPSLVIEP